METLLPLAQNAVSGMTSLPLLSLIVWLPLLGAVLTLFYSREQKGLVQGTALLVSLLTFVASLGLLWQFKADYRAFQLVEDHAWIPALGARYTLGVDGISLWIVMLTTALTPVAILSSFKAIDRRPKEYYFSLLALEFAMLGALVSLDVLLFYIFWEAMLVPMFLLIGIWGGQNRIYATIKFFIFTMVGSLLMLIGILYVYFKTGDGGAASFNLAAMLAVDLTASEQTWLFLAFGLAFAIKVPLFPLHTWLPDAHTEAPTAGSVILAAVLLKMGTYGLLRYAMPLFPMAVIEFAPWIGVLSVIGIVYGALVAMVQKDVKRLVAYSSVSHLGFVVLGLVAMTPQGVEGSVFQMLAHGVSTGGLFLCIGMLYERRHTRLISEFGGLTRQIPVFAVIFLIITLSSAGLPGMNGFVGEFLVLLGAFTSHVLYGFWGRALTAVAATGMILGAVYLLWMFQRVMFGPLSNPKNRVLKDMNARELIYISPIIALIFVMGVYPEAFMKYIRPSTQEFFYIFNAKLARSQALEAGEGARAAQLDLSSWPGSERLTAPSALASVSTPTPDAASRAAETDARDADALPAADARLLDADAPPATPCAAAPAEGCEPIHDHDGPSDASRPAREVASIDRVQLPIPRTE